MAEKAGLKEILMGIFAVLGATTAATLGKSIFNVSGTLTIAFISGVGAVIGLGVGQLIGKFFSKAKK